jgi:hypothetical protein
VPKLEKAIPGGGQIEAPQIGEDGMLLRIGVMGPTITGYAVLTSDAVGGTVEALLVLAVMKGQISQMVEGIIAKMLRAGPSDESAAQPAQA